MGSLVYIDDEGMIDTNRQAIREYAASLHKLHTPELSWIACARRALKKAEEQYHAAFLCYCIDNTKFPEVPEYPAEKVREQADLKYRGDDEKVSTTPVQFIVYEGVRLESRYDKAEEYRRMMRLIAAIDVFDTNYRPMISGLYCDSKQCDAYTFLLRKDPYAEPDAGLPDGCYYPEPVEEDDVDYGEDGDYPNWDNLNLSELRLHIDQVARAVIPGHNGISFEWPDYSMDPKLQAQLEISPDGDFYENI